MAIIINEIVTESLKGEKHLRFKLSAGKQNVLILNYLTPNIPTDTAIPISEWNEVVEFIKTELNGKTN